MSMQLPMKIVTGDRLRSKASGQLLKVAAVWSDGKVDAVAVVMIIPVPISLVKACRLEVNLTVLAVRGKIKRNFGKNPLEAASELSGAFFPFETPIWDFYRNEKFIQRFLNIHLLRIPYFHDPCSGKWLKIPHPLWPWIFNYICKKSKSQKDTYACCWRDWHSHQISNQSQSPNHNQAFKCSTQKRVASASERGELCICLWR